MTSPLSYDQALRLIRERVTPLHAESLPLSAALGRMIAHEFRAPHDLPGFANSAMDGYAVRAQDLDDAGDGGLELVDRILAGDLRDLHLPPGAAMAIMTGARMPGGADTVVIQERAQVRDGRVWLSGATEPGANLRPADDDCGQGEVLLSAGQVLSAARIGLLAAFGLDSVSVMRRPRVAVLATGDELLPPGAIVRPGQRYDSNRPMLAALAESAGASVVRADHVPDDGGRLREWLLQASQQADLLLTSGGVSAGVADLLPGLAQEIGEIVFWKLRMKPGMPVLCARIGTAWMLGLPGNPVSAAVCFQVLAQPLLDAMQGSDHSREVRGKARLAQPWRKRHGRLEFLRARLHFDAQGQLWATPMTHQGSGALSQMAQAQALIRLEEGEREYPVGAMVSFLGCSPPWVSP